MAFVVTMAIVVALGYFVYTQYLVESTEVEPEFFPEIPPVPKAEPKPAKKK